MSDIERWLDDLGLGQYGAAFAENAIDDTLLVDLNDADLEKLGVGPMGHRKRLLTAIAKLRNDATEVAQDMMPAAPAGLGTEAERRQLSVMFCDMVGSTALSTRLDPEDYREVIRAYQDACAGVITRFDGYVARFMGDGVLAYFGWPRAHEDDAARAINAGLGIVEAVATLAPANSEAEPIALRIG
ncbi:MAG: adenylate/guanylate cyclase domain-containing protein, partial [Alphaproteobacteria bacterium]